ncbi:myxochelin export MFS transporter MxcK [Pyxidicoccus xibeiensis]|uniref:myxochelin export MFS transporter MxcK n=1 Tax=Pyxidicoccus xibeiensis TaxID=2906759 RepID=UPI0020A7678C|nr:myxochelin export MFS transporter MxcK [Pyxidicoccus xibeiensis]MCP3144853.1 myxochelin export MFS transporter MxcK [Pyxidicoccus xibeiensis]
MTSSSPPRQERLRVLLLACVQFTHLMDFMIIMPLGPEFIRLFSLSTAQFGALVSAYTLASAAMGVLGVFWVDRFDRKRTLLVIYAGFIAATLACGAAQSHLWLLAARTLAGACAGLMSAVIMAIVADVVPPERRGRAIGTVLSTLGLSAVAGVPLGLGLASVLGWRMPFWVICGLAAIAWLGLARLLPALDQHLTAAPGKRQENPLAALVSPQLVLGWALTFSVVFSSFLLIPYLSAYMVGNVGLTQTDLPWVYLAGGAATLFTARKMGQLADRHGAARVLAWLLIGTVGPHLVFTHLPPSPLPVVMGVFVVFMALTSTRAIPAIALISAKVPPALRGRFMAVNMAASDAASGLSAWVSGLMLATAPGGALIGFGAAGWLAVAVTTLSLSILWAFTRSAVRAPQGTEPRQSLT